jgi:hypothetical protein
MTDEKLLHVSCIVRQTGVYDLLRALEIHKVGNVEVRPVAQMLALPAPDGSNGAHPRKKKSKPRGNRWKAVVRLKVAAALPLREKRRPSEIAKQTDENPKSVYSALRRLVDIGIVKKVGSEFMRVKPDPEVS